MGERAPFDRPIWLSWQRPSYKWILERKNGRTVSAVDIQRRYLELAQKHLTGMDEESDWVLREWEATLDGLERDPMSLLGRLDWVSKKWLLQMFIDEEKVDWKDPWLLSLDLEYHNINANRGLYYDLENTGVAHRVLTEAQVDRACSEPPKDTRAKARSETNY